MPRAQLPPLLSPLEFLPDEELIENLRWRLAPHVAADVVIPDEALHDLAVVVAGYRAMLNGGLVSSVAQTCELLLRIVAGGPKLRRALPLLLDERSSVDIDTYDILNPMAVRAQTGSPEALRELQGAAKARLGELKDQRVHSERELLASLCGQINVIFHGIHGRCLSDNLQPSDPIARRKFALEVLDASEIATADYDQHPARLDELLDTNVIPLEPLAEP